MTTIVPRWEWRTFGDDFGAAEDAFAASAPDTVQESDELYILSREGGDTVKVRDRLLDVKHLERVNEDGLEQWKPVEKAEFPVGEADARSVLARLGVSDATLERDAYTFDEFVDEVV